MHSRILIVCLSTALILGLNATAQASGWAVIVGIDRYHSRAISELHGAANDARALADTMADVFGIPQNQLLVYTSDSDASHLPSTGNLVRALRYTAREARPDDLFVLAFSGHGAASGRENYLLTYYSEMGALTDTALRLSRVKQLIEAVPCRQKLVILDACRNDPNGGKGDEPNFLSETFAKGIAVKAKSGSQSEVVATLFSCSLGERSFEWPAKERGFFSWYLEQGLKGAAANSAGKIILNSLVAYLQGAVPDGVHRVLGVDRQQNPYVIMEGADPGNWLLARVPGPDMGAAIKEEQDQLERLQRREKEPAASERQRQQIETEAATEEAAQKKKLQELDDRIRSMQERLGTPMPLAGDSLDSLLAMLKEKEAEEERLLKLRRQQEEARKRREEDRRKREEELRRLEAGKKANKWGEFQEDVKKYKHIISSKYGKGLEDAAWNQLVSKHVIGSASITPGDLASLERTVSKKIYGAYIEPVTGMRFVYVPGGCYQMGCGDWTSECDDDEKPVHEACVDGLWMGKYEVTQVQWKTVMGENPSFFKKGDSYPVENVTWNDAQEFIMKLNSRNGVDTFRLPTEAEWEYACRSGGEPEKFAGGEDINRVAWCDGNSAGSTHPVGAKMPNSLGLFDMSGNVWEWCEDWYLRDAYPKHTRNNPVVDAFGSDRVYRGGAWDSLPSLIRCARRDGNTPGYGYHRLGLRLVRAK